MPATETKRVFVIRYTDEADPGFGVATWRTKAADIEDAADRFFSSADPDDGWRIISIREA